MITLFNSLTTVNATTFREFYWNLSFTKMKLSLSNFGVVSLNTVYNSISPYNSNFFNLI